MLQPKELEQRFETITQAIGEACQTVQGASVSPQLKECLSRLDQQSGSARQVMQSHDEERIRECVDDLESLGDEAKRALRNEQSAPPQLKNAVLKAHDGLSDLKHQLLH